MNTSEIYRFLDGFLPCTVIKSWLVLPLDQAKLKLKQKPKHPRVIVINTLKSNENGVGHWICCIQINTTSVFFCSFGNSAKSYGLNHHITMENVLKLQAIGSILCGVYVIWFIYYFVMHRSVKPIKKLFKRNTRQNDKIVVKLFKKIRFCKSSFRRTIKNVQVG